MCPIGSAHLAPSPAIPNLALVTEWRGTVHFMEERVEAQSHHTEQWEDASCRGLAPFYYLPWLLFVMFQTWETLARQVIHRGAQSQSQSLLLNYLLFCHCNGKLTHNHLQIFDYL